MAVKRRKTIPSRFRVGSTAQDRCSLSHQQQELRRFALFGIHLINGHPILVMVFSKAARWDNPNPGPTGKAAIHSQRSRCPAADGAHLRSASLGQGHLLNEKLGRLAAVKRCRRAHGAAVMKRSDRDVITLRERGHFPDLAETIPSEARTKHVDDLFPQQILETSGIMNRAAQAKGRYGLARDLAQCAEIRDAARFVEPKQMKSLERGRQTRGVPGESRPAPSKTKSDLLPQPSAVSRRWRTLRTTLPSLGAAGGGIGIAKARNPAFCAT